MKGRFVDTGEWLGEAALSRLSVPLLSNGWTLAVARERVQARIPEGAAGKSWRDAAQQRRCNLHLGIGPQSALL